MGALDIAISVVIILFILSIVTEKFTQLIKSYTSVFNILFLGLSVAFIIRGIIIIFVLKNLCFLAISLITICLGSDIYLLFYFRRKRSIRTTLIYFGVGLFINICSMICCKYSLYLTLGCGTLYFSLVSLQLLPEINFKIRGRWFGTRFFKRIEHINSSLIDEPVRGKEITTLSFLTGITVAYLFNADFFTIIKYISSDENAASLSLSWPENEFPLSYSHNYFNYEDYLFDSSFCFGILLTGFFLSFGSKFFHDLLETLFYAKKAKAAQSDYETYKLDSADNIEKWVNEYDLEKFYLRERINILNKGGFMAVGIGKVEFEGQIVDGLRIFTDEDHQEVEDLLKVAKGRNVFYKIPYQIFMGGGAIVPSAPLIISPALKITNQELIKNAGAITYPVEIAGKSGDFLLTCYHVVKTSKYKWDQYNSKSGKVAITNQQDDVLGSIFAGGRTSFAEAALIEVDKGNTIAAPFYPGFRLSQKNARIITKADVGANVLMYKKSLNEIIRGKITASNIIAKIYFDGEGQMPFKMFELIEVKNINNKPIQEEGDSGNLLFDEHYKPIGIVFAKNDLSTFVMRLDQAFKVFKDLTVTLKI